MSYITSKARVISHGEVFTNIREVRGMLELAYPAGVPVGAVCLEPACGHGVFLVEILRQKLADPKAQDTPFTEILGTLWGGDIQLDNVLATRKALADHIREAYPTFDASYLEPVIANQIIHSDFVAGVRLNEDGSKGEPLPWETGLLLDLIIGNPPYQDEGRSAAAGTLSSASATYPAFCLKSFALRPRKAAWIIPQRWFTSGKGTTEFRRAMYASKNITDVMLYNGASEAFPTRAIQGGVMYFLWDRDAVSDALRIRTFGEGGVSIRPFIQPPFDVFIRRPKDFDVASKIISQARWGFVISSLKTMRPFDLESNYPTQPEGEVKTLVLKRGKRFFEYVPMSAVSDNLEILGKWKTILSAARGGENNDPVIARPNVLEPGVAFTRT